MGNENSGFFGSMFQSNPVLQSQTTNSNGVTTKTYAPGNSTFSNINNTVGLLGSIGSLATNIMNYNLQRKAYRDNKNLNNINLDRSADMYNNNRGMTDDVYYRNTGNHIAGHDLDRRHI